MTTIRKIAKQLFLEMLDETPDPTSLAESLEELDYDYDEIGEQVFDAIRHLQEMTIDFVEDEL